MISHKAVSYHLLSDFKPFSKQWLYLQPTLHSFIVFLLYVMWYRLSLWPVYVICSDSVVSQFLVLSQPLPGRTV